MKKFIKAFFAVDNQVNEQSVVGAFWGLVTFVLMILHVACIGRVELELLITSGSSMLLCFGIAGVKHGK